MRLVYFILLFYWDGIWSVDLVPVVAQQGVSGRSYISLAATLAPDVWGLRFRAQPL